METGVNRRKNQENDDKRRRKFGKRAQLCVLPNVDFVTVVPDRVETRVLCRPKTASGLNFLLVFGSKITICDFEGNERNWKKTGKS